jgi:diguanylate cyclase (GGDEF)-like protein
VLLGGQLSTIAWLRHATIARFFHQLQRSAHPPVKHADIRNFPYAKPHRRACVGDPGAARRRRASRWSRRFAEWQRMADGQTHERPIFLSDQPGGRGECRFAAAVIGCSTLIFLGLAPFAKLPLAPVPAFIPIYQSALLINDLMTAVFLLGQSQYSHGKALIVLAGSYLFTALMSSIHALTFPGLFTPSGLLGAGVQTTAWLYMFWHGGFPLFVIGYALCGVEQPRRAHAAMLLMAAAVAALVVACALFATAGQRFLPGIMQGNLHTPVMRPVVAAVWALNLSAAIAVSRRRPLSVLDLWLIVTMCAWMFDVGLSALFNIARFDLGFYAGRIYGLAAASLVLGMLLCGHSRLYMQLIKLHRSEREKSAELQRITAIDALSGIANRRAFDETLYEEWRRMLRHGTALSLLMIDVDYFKRFNDAYGHVAGDQCLRVVAHAVAGKARRAGELAARYGGEEFAVLLPQTGIGEACKLAEIICAAVRDCQIPHEQSGAAPHVTISVGVASIGKYPDATAAFSREGPAEAFSAGATILVETADLALYRAKMAGRNQVAVASANDAAAPGELAAAS